MQRLWAVCLTLLVSAGFTYANEYTKWVKDEKTKTLSCDYKYTNNDGKPATQKVVIYYADADRKNWAYYYNAKDTPWARCAIPGNAKFDEKVMYWQKLDDKKKDGYLDFPKAGFCPTPADGKTPIANLPLPPK